MRGYYPGEREYSPELAMRRARAAAAETGAGDGATATIGQGAGRRIDRVRGILLGVVFGIAVVAAFLLGSGGTIDAPSTHGVHTGKPAAHARPDPQKRE